MQRAGFQKRAENFVWGPGDMGIPVFLSQVRVPTLPTLGLAALCHQVVHVLYGEGVGSRVAVLLLLPPVCPHMQSSPPAFLGLSGG